MQLLRLGLVNYTTIGQSFQKENKDNHIIAALIVGGCEGLFCILSTLASLKLGHDSKTNRFKSKRKHGTFFVVNIVYRVRIGILTLFVPFRSAPRCIPSLIPSLDISFRPLICRRTERNDNIEKC